MGPVLLQEETGVPGENLRRLVESNWTTLLTCDKDKLKSDNYTELESNPSQSSQARVLLPR